MKQQRFSVRKRIRSFGYAMKGLRILIREEHNARIHLFVAVCVLIAGAAFQISGMEWISVILAIGLVLSIETINAAIENLADFVSPEKHKWIQKIKDLSASAVLLSVIAAVVVGLIVFVPKILTVFSGNQI